MKHFHIGLPTGLLAAATGAIAVTAMLGMSIPSAAASGGVLDDQPATTHCDVTLTGVHSGVINVAAPLTYCLVNLKQTGAVNVASGAALSVTAGSIIVGAVTATAPKAFTFCASATKPGAIKVVQSSGFVIIGNGGDGGLLATPCGANNIPSAVTLTGNLGGVELGGNAIAGSLTVSGNIAPGGGVPTENKATEIEANVVTGLTTCANNNPAPVNDNRPNTFTGGANGQCVGL
jgi:hypothetical protein